jgi:hypothetical protein
VPRKRSKTPPKTAAKAPQKVSKPSLSKVKARRVAVAGAIAAGRPLTETARALDVSRRTVHRDAASSEVRQLLASLVSDASERIQSLFAGALDVIEDAYAARRFAITRDGCEVDLGADHYARLAAAKRFIELATAGRPTPKPPEDKPNERRKLTLAEFEELYREHQSQTPEAGIQ